MMMDPEAEGMVDANILFCIEDEDNGNEMLGGYGRWYVDQRGNGALQLRKCDGASLGIGMSAEYAFSFSFTNPASEQPAPTVSVEAWLYPSGGGMRDTLRQWKTIEVVKPSCLGCGADTTRLGVFGGADPLRIITASFVTRCSRVPAFQLTVAGRDMVCVCPGPPRRATRSRRGPTA